MHFKFYLIDEEIVEEENKEEIVDGEVAEENVEVIEKLKKQMKKMMEQRLKR